MTILFVAKRAGLALLFLALAACQSTSIKQIDSLSEDSRKATILLMPIDIQLSEMSAGGAIEPKAVWTVTAEKHTTAALKDFVRDREANFKLEVRVADNRSRDDTEVQLVKLYSVVGDAAIKHRLLEGNRLPSKGDKFDWSLGPSVRVLRERYNADYGLFVFIRDTYTSPGRAAAVFFAAAVFGVALPSGSQLGYASLVDLESGDIVWLNRLFRSGGDLRQAKPARETINALLHDFPK